MTQRINIFRYRATLKGQVTEGSVHGKLLTDHSKICDFLIKIRYQAKKHLFPCARDIYILREKSYCVDGVFRNGQCHAHTLITDKVSISDLSF